MDIVHNDAHTICIARLWEKDLGAGSRDDKARALSVIVSLKLISPS